MHLLFEQVYILNKSHSALGHNLHWVTFGHILHLILFCFLSHFTHTHWYQIIKLKTQTLCKQSNAGVCSESNWYLTKSKYTYDFSLEHFHFLINIACFFPFWQIYGLKTIGLKKLCIVTSCMILMLLCSIHTAVYLNMKCHIFWIAPKRWDKVKNRDYKAINLNGLKSSPHLNAKYKSKRKLLSQCANWNCFIL